MADQKLRFQSDYMEGAHESIIEKLVETNRVKTGGYGEDEFCESAKRKIRAACGSEQAKIYFLVGGTQTNATVIDALLKSYQGVIAAGSGHINVHEAGAIELGGHKVIQLAAKNGKLTADAFKACFDAYWQDVTHEHMVMPAMVYLSQPTEVGTLYTLSELEAISAPLPQSWRLSVRGRRAPCLRTGLPGKRRDAQGHGQALRRVLYRRHQMRRTLRRGRGVPAPGHSAAFLFRHEAARLGARKGKAAGYPV